MEFYYQSEFEKLSGKCPPDNYKPIEKVSFRWVFSPIQHPLNFKAQAEKNPKNLNDKDDMEKCVCFALSFHISPEASKLHFSYFSKMGPLAFKRLGTHLAEGLLSLGDGVSGEIESNGHFNFHPVKENRFPEKFIIIDEL